MEMLPEGAHPSILKEWDCDFYRAIFSCREFIDALPPSSECGEVAWRPDGSAKGTFRLKCGAKKGTGKCTKSCAASAHAKVAEQVLTKCQEEVRKSL